MKVRVLGSAAGGGFPQWNCGCLNCRGVRAGTISAQARTQTSVAIESADGSWFLIHASPDVRTQLASYRPLQPRSLRDTPLCGIILTNGDLDQCLGLLSLRESQPLHLYATEPVRRGFVEGNALYRALDRFPGHITWHELKLASEQRLLTMDGRETGLSIEAVPVPGKVPLYLEGTQLDPAQNVALIVTDGESGQRLGYAPCVGGWDFNVSRLLNEANALFFDGTFWSDDELAPLGSAARGARDMAHWPLSGTDGSLARLSRSRIARRILIHINNTNPVLREDSPERQQVEAAGLQVAYDGMELTL